MANYLCKDCVHNNHGWCKALKKNKLKEIDKCAMKDDGSKKLELRPFEKLTGSEPELPTEQPVKKVSTEAYKVLGKREMLWTVQRQAIAIKNDKTLPDKSKFDMLCHCLNAICQAQEYLEDLHDINQIIDSEIDQMMLEDSKMINTIL